MGTKLVDERVVALRVTPGEEPLGEKLHAYRRTFVFREFAREQRRKPIATEQAAHWRAGTSLGEKIVLFFSKHRKSLFCRLLINQIRPDAASSARPCGRGLPNFASVNLLAITVGSGQACDLLALRAVTTAFRRHILTAVGYAGKCKQYGD